MSALDTQALGLLPALVVCNEAHRFLVAEQFRVLGGPPSAILLEPVGRNTAPALTLSALQAVVGGTDVPSISLWFEVEHAAVSAVSARREARLRRVTRRVSHTPLPRLPL